MFISIIIIVIKYLILIIPILLNVALLTLFERKIIGYIQRRQGPIRTGILGIFQPLADGLKLLIKEPILPINSNYLMFLSAPILTLLLSLINWILIPFNRYDVLVDLNVGILFILGISSLSVYGVIIAGWASNSKYAFLGALRSAAQMISYEVSIGIIIITVLLGVGSLNLNNIIKKQEDIYFMFPFFPLFLLFLISSIAETNRHPFDLPEAEAELVSGYNVEYSSVGFALFFIGEYVNIIFMSALNVVIFLGGWFPLNNYILIFFSSFFYFVPFFYFAIKLLFIIFLFLIIRAILPRYRYDQLMYLGWKVFLPLSLSFLLLYSGALIAFDWLP